MMHGDSFLQAIRANPDDDALRLICADWLMEQDDPARADRGEFIRLQVERARLAPGDPRRDALQERERRLLERNWEAWIGRLRELAGSGKGHEPWLFTGFHAESSRHFRRGFVEKLTLDAAAFISRWPELFHTTPLRHLRLTGAGRHAMTLAACPGLAEIRQLDFIDYYSEPLDANGMQALAASPHLDRLRVLNLYNNNLGPSGVSALASAGWWSQLVYLNLTNNGLGDAGAEALAAAGSTGQLRQLELGRNGITDRGATALAGSPLLRGLRVLNMEANELTTAGCRALRSSTQLPLAAELNLTGNPGVR